MKEVEDIRKSILIVDDEESVTTILADGLRNVGYRVEVANSAAEAIEVIRKEPFSLVVVDYRMPDQDGLALARAIRRMAPETVVVLVTAYGTDAIRQMSADLGVAAYVEKPFTLAQIREVIHRNLGEEGQSVEQVLQSPGPGADPSASELLENLRRNSGARCVMLVSDKGYPVEVVGQTRGLDLQAIGAVMAANFAATTELARLLGAASSFNSTYHEGPNYNLYAYRVRDDLLLAVIFDAGGRAGTVWYYTKQVATDLKSKGAGSNGNRMQAGGLHEVSGFQDALAAQLDQMFPTDGQDGQDDDFRERELMSFDEAVAAGLIPADLGGSNGAEG